MYVDDCLALADEIGAAMELQQSLDKMMERGGFNLTKWASNSKEVSATLPSKSRRRPLPLISMPVSPERYWECLGIHQLAVSTSVF